MTESNFSTAPFKLKFSYFPIPVRSVCARVVCQYSAVDLQFERLSFKEWFEGASMEDSGPVVTQGEDQETVPPTASSPLPPLSQDRKRFPLGDMPVLEITESEGDEPHVMVESSVIYYYLGNLTGFWPRDSLVQAGLVAECFATHEQIFTGAHWDEEDKNLFDTMSMEDPQQIKAARQGAVLRRLKFYLKRIHLLVGKLHPAVVTIYDIHLTHFVQSIHEGFFDYLEGGFIAGCVEYQNIIKRMALVLKDEKLAKILKEVVATSAAEREKKEET